MPTSSVPYRQGRRPLDVDRIATMACTHVSASVGCCYMPAATPCLGFAVRATEDDVLDLCSTNLLGMVVRIGTALSEPKIRAPLLRRSRYLVIAIEAPSNQCVGALGVASTRDREWSARDLRRLADLGRFALYRLTSG